MQNLNIATILIYHYYIHLKLDTLFNTFENAIINNELPRFEGVKG